MENVIEPALLSYEKNPIAYSIKLWLAFLAKVVRKTCDFF